MFSLDSRPYTSVDDPVSDSVHWVVEGPGLEESGTGDEEKGDWRWYSVETFVGRPTSTPPSSPHGADPSPGYTLELVYSLRSPSTRSRGLVEGRQGLVGVGLY